MDQPGRMSPLNVTDRQPFTLFRPFSPGTFHTREVSLATRLGKKWPSNNTRSTWV